MKKKKLTDKEKLDILLAKTTEVLCGMVQQRMPESGYFQKFFVSFEYPGTEYEGFLWVEHNATEYGGNGRLTAAMRQTGSDRVVQHYMMIGTKKTVVSWLKDFDNVKKLRTDYAQLKQSVAQFD